MVRTRLQIQRRKAQKRADKKDRRQECLDAILVVLREKFPDSKLESNEKWVDVIRQFLNFSKNGDFKGVAYSLWACLCYLGSFKEWRNYEVFYDKVLGKVEHLKENGLYFGHLIGIEQPQKSTIEDIDRVSREKELGILEMRSRKLQDEACLIYYFIIENFTAYDLERYTDTLFSEEENREKFGLNFGSIENFRAMQKKFVDRASNEMIEKLNILMLMIESKEMKLMDKECMVPFTASGFCFNTEGKLYVFNER